MGGDASVGDPGRTVEPPHAVPADGSVEQQPRGKQSESHRALARARQHDRDAERDEQDVFVAADSAPNCATMVKLDGKEFLPS